MQVSMSFANINTTTALFQNQFCFKLKDREVIILTVNDDWCLGRTLL